MKKSFLCGLMMTGAILSLGACEKTREQFDFSKKAPDEFAVVKRAPLELPPDFKTLATPQPGAPRPQEQSTTNLARNAILGVEETSQSPQNNTPSDGENILLQKSGAANTPSNIRQTVDEETARIAEEQAPGIDKLKKMMGKKVEAPSKVVDPVAEAARIKANKEAGKPITTGKTPTVE